MTLASDFNLSEKRRKLSNKMYRSITFTSLYRIWRIVFVTLVLQPSSVLRVEGANLNSYGESELDVQFVGTVEKERLYQEYASSICW